MAADKAKDFLLSLPKFTPTEAWGDPNSMERQQITKLFNAMGGGRSIEGKLQFLQRIVAEIQKFQSPRRIISSIIILECLKAVIHSFNASSAGFVFEGLSALLQGSQEAEVSPKVICRFRILLLSRILTSPYQPETFNKTTNIEGSYTVQLMDWMSLVRWFISSRARMAKQLPSRSLDLIKTTSSMRSRPLLRRYYKRLKPFSVTEHEPTGICSQTQGSRKLPEKYAPLQYTAGYSERIRKKREAAAAAQQPAQQDTDSEQASNAQLAAQRELDEAIKEEWNLLLESRRNTISAQNS